MVLKLYSLLSSDWVFSFSGLLVSEINSVAFLLWKPTTTSFSLSFSQSSCYIMFVNLFVFSTVNFLVLITIVGVVSGKVLVNDLRLGIDNPWYFLYVHALLWNLVYWLV